VLLAIRFEANAHVADDVCFTFPITSEPDKNFVVRYNITSDEIVVHMNLRSIDSNSILRSRLLPARFKQLYGNSGNLAEPYVIEFCASSEIIGDDTVASTPASATILSVHYTVTRSGWYRPMQDISKTFLFAFAVHSQTCSFDVLHKYFF